MFKNCAPFIKWMKIKNNVQADDPNDMDKSYMYKIIECTDIYLKTSGSI